MNDHSPIQLLPLADDRPGSATDAEPSSGCGCGGCGCGESAAAPSTPTDRGAAAAGPEPAPEYAAAGHEHAFSVAGMTCEHCARAVTAELTALDGVTDVRVDLVAGGTSTVRVVSSTPLSDDTVAAALDEAGDYRLV